MSHDSHHHERDSDTCNAASVSERVTKPYGDEPQEPRQEPTDEELCDHSYAGDDGDVGRCYCGAQLYPKGGRASVDLRAVLIRAADALRVHGVHPVEAEVRAVIAALDEEAERD